MKFDPDYVALNSAVDECPSSRRASAMQQWATMRSHDEYRIAMECIRGGSDWRAFWGINRHSLVSSVRVFRGESIAVAAPLVVHSADTARELAGGGVSCPLVAALAALDLDAVVQSFQVHDPLSWHCECPPLSARWRPGPSCQTRLSVAQLVLDSTPGHDQGGCTAPQAPHIPVTTQAPDVRGEAPSGAGAAHAHRDRRHPVLAARACRARRRRSHRYCPAPSQSPSEHVAHRQAQEAHILYIGVPKARRRLLRMDEGGGGSERRENWSSSTG